MRAAAVSEVAAPETAALPSPPQVWWDRTLFSSLETDDNHCPELFDLTGGPRYLVHGPYLRLERGLWRVTVPIELCPDAARRQLAVQVGVEPNYLTVDLPYGVPGRHDVQVEFRLIEADIVQVRLLLKRAAFHGELRFVGALVENLGEAEAAGEPG